MSEDFFRWMRWAEAAMDAAAYAEWLAFHDEDVT